MPELVETLEQITEWFAEVPYAGLILPTGWFGRPYDNQHRLTWSQARRHKLLLELDEQLLLVLTTPGRPRIDTEGLTLTFEQLVFDWQGYGDLHPHAEHFRTDELRFVGSRHNEPTM